MTDNPPVKVSFSPFFLKGLKRLRKKYPRVSDDIRPVIEQIEQGETPGDQVQRVGYTVYKVRVRNRDAQRGKSGGYRVVYYLQRGDSVLMVTVYSKSDVDDIPPEEIARMIDESEE